MLDTILEIQEEVNREAIRLGRPTVNILDQEESDRILELIELKTFPKGWEGTEPTGDKVIPYVYPDGTTQLTLF
jgi:DNA sulfur modification protein DndC